MVLGSLRSRLLEATVAATLASPSTSSACEVNLEIESKDVDAFITTKLEAYVINEAKPSISGDVDKAFARFLVGLNPRFNMMSHDHFKAAICRKLFYKAGHALVKHGTRKRTSVNVYVLGCVVQTFKGYSISNKRRTRHIFLWLPIAFLYPS